MEAHASTQKVIDRAAMYITQAECRICHLLHSWQQLLIVVGAELYRLHNACTIGSLLAIEASKALNLISDNGAVSAITVALRTGRRGVKK